jgi:hypothetical protein
MYLIKQLHGEGKEITFLCETMAQALNMVGSFITSAYLKHKHGIREKERIHHWSIIDYETKLLVFDYKYNLEQI